MFFHGKNRKTGVFSHSGKFGSLEDFHIAMSAQICQRHFDMVHEPDHKIRGSIVPQDQAAAPAQDAVGAVEKVLRVRVMMEAVGADDRIKSSFIKRQIFTVADQKLRVGEIFCLCDMDHLRRKIQSDIVFPKCQKMLILYREYVPDGVQWVFRVAGKGSAHT